MRAFLISVGLFVAAGAALQVGCGGDDSGGGGGGGGGAVKDCLPEHSPYGCQAAKDVQSDCIALVDYSGSDTPTLRMAQLSLESPFALTTSIVTTLVSSGITLNMPECYLGGDPVTNGNFNWLFQFDIPNKKLKTGSAKPVEDPTQGYSFENDTLMQSGSPFKVAPINLDITIDADGNFSASGSLDVTVPIYTDKQASAFVLLPLHGLTINMGKLSSDHNCIGNFDGEHLSPEDPYFCKSEEPFITGASLSGFIIIEEADKVLVEQANTTLCAILAGMPGEQTCTRTNGVIDFQGDTCSDGTDGCTDSVKVTATFAASAVKLNP